jgi:hypothetical protein
MIEKPSIFFNPLEIFLDKENTKKRGRDGAIGA